MNHRYPHYLCRSCAALASAPDGRKLHFTNGDAAYADSGEAYKSHVCFIKGITCWAQEAQFGGTVIEAIPPEALRQFIDRSGRPTVVAG